MTITGNRLTLNNNKKVSTQFYKSSGCSDYIQNLQAQNGKRDIDTCEYLRTK